MADIAALATRQAADIGGRDQARRALADNPRGRTDRKLARPTRGDAPGGAGRHIERPGLRLEGRAAPADDAEILTVGPGRDLARKQHEAMLAVAGLTRQDLAIGEVVDGEADMAPARSFRRDLMDAPVGIGRLRLHQQF